MNSGPFTHLTFDCYGTLIDWETGILAALMPLFESHGIAVTPEGVLERYVVHEVRLETESWRLYRDVLTGVANAIGSDFGIKLTTEEARVLADSVGSWPPFVDTVPALRQLKERFKLVIVSNIDDALFAGTARLLEVPFDEVVTAEQVRSYKPARAHFHEAIQRMNVPVGQVLHVAQSLYHDHEPARELGIRTAWVRRPSRLGISGVAPVSSIQPDFTVTSLRELACELVA
jgi:2-haloacid dehalogenase